MEKEKKITFTVEKIEDDMPKPSGVKLLKIVIRHNGKLYKKAVKKADYLDENRRKGIHALWIKTFKEQISEDSIDEKEIKRQADKLAGLVGREVEETYE